MFNNSEMTLGRVTDSGSYGKRVELIDRNGTVYQNSHLDNFGDIGRYRQGDTIPPGTWIGSVGDTGNAKGTPPHNHFEARPQSDGNFANGRGPQGQTNPELIDPKTGKPYADAFSMGRPDAGSLHTDRGGITGDPKYDKNGDDRSVAQPDESRSEKDPANKPGEKPPEGVKQPVKQGSQGRPARRVHRLTDRNSAGGVIDLCVAKTVFVNNLPISTDGSQGTGHPIGSDPSDNPPGTAPGSAAPRQNPNTTANCAGERPRERPQPDAPDAPPGNPSNIVELGRQLQAEGFRVSEHPQFGGTAPVHSGAGHRENRAIDVNIGYGNVEANDPQMGARFDALASRLRAQGFSVIWRSAGHYNHMHVEEPRGGLRPNANPPDPQAPPSPNLPAGGSDDCGPTVPQSPAAGNVPAQQQASTDHCYHCWFTNNGSRNVFAENRPVNFEGNLDTCGHARIEGSPDVFVGDSSYSPPPTALGDNRPARNFKEANRGGNASPSNIRCRQKGLDDIKKKADPNDPNADGPQWKADPDDPNKPTGSNPGVPDGTIPPDGQTSRDRVIQQMDQDYANRDQWAGGKSSTAGNAAFKNLGFGGMPNGTAWCAVYVNSNLKDAGAGYAPSMAAASPKCFKQVQPSQAKPGDVLVFSGHTAMVREVKPNGDIVLQGGNQGGGSGAVTRNTIRASNGYNYGGQGLVGVYDPHDKAWNDANLSKDCKPGGSPADPNNDRPPAPTNGEDCPPETAEEKAAREGKGIKTDQDGVNPGPDSGRPPDPTFGGASSILGGVALGGAGGTILGGITGSILGGMGQSGFGAGAGRGFINPPLVDPSRGPYNAPTQNDPVKQAAEAFNTAMTADPGPAVSALSTCERALELARAATGKQYPSGTEVAAQLPNAQKLWWNETVAANEHRYAKMVAAYKQAGINSYRPLRAETMTRIMAHQSGWGNSKCVKNAAYDKNNPIGVGWDGSSWYEYPNKAAGYTAMWSFLALGTDGSLGRYMLPSSLEDNVSAEVDFIYKQGLTNGTVPPAVMLIKDPNTN